MKHRESLPRPQKSLSLTKNTHKRLLNYIIKLSRKLRMQRSKPRMLPDCKRKLPVKLSLQREKLKRLPDRKLMPRRRLRLKRWKPMRLTNCRRQLWLWLKKKSKTLRNLPRSWIRLKNQPSMNVINRGFIISKNNSSSSWKERVKEYPTRFWLQCH